MSVSCSDKIAKWCYVGIQGSLLSLLLDKPVYFTSFTVPSSTPYCANVLNRAFYQRFNEVTLNFPYKQNIMVHAQSPHAFEFSKADGKQPCPSSISWCKYGFVLCICYIPQKSELNFRKLEVAIEGKKQGVTKKNANTKKARLQISKIELYRIFLRIIQMYEINSLEISNLKTLSYFDMKHKAIEYRQNWNVVKCLAFKIWTKKDEKLLKFCID